MNKPLRFNIVFSETDPVTRLCELFNLIETKKIDTNDFRLAIITLLDEFYGKNTKHEEAFYLIQAIDYIKPSRYFTNLQDLVVNPGNQHMINVIATNGLSMHFYLINSIMRMDLEESLSTYLINLGSKPRPSEYYQVVARYAYQKNRQSLFNKLLNKIFPFLNEKENLDKVILTIEEYLFYKEDVTLVFSWLFESHVTLKKHDFFIPFLLKLENMLESEDYGKAKLYYPTLLLIKLLVGKKLTNKLFKKVIYGDIKNKEDFFRFIGFKSKIADVVKGAQEFLVQINTEEDPMTFELDYDELRVIYDGKKEREKLEGKKESLEIALELEELSLNYGP